MQAVRLSKAAEVLAHLERVIPGSGKDFQALAYRCPYGSADDNCGTWCPLLEVVDVWRYTDRELRQPFVLHPGELPREGSERTGERRVHLHCGAGTRVFALEEGADDAR